MGTYQFDSFRSGQDRRERSPEDAEVQEDGPERALVLDLARELERLLIRREGRVEPAQDVLLPANDALPRPLRQALDQLDTEVRKLHEEAGLAA